MCPSSAAPGLHWSSLCDQERSVTGVSRQSNIVRSSGDHSDTRQRQQQSVLMQLLSTESKMTTAMEVSERENISCCDSRKYLSRDVEIIFIVM